MPPPPSTSKRMTANPTRPARYRPGKPTQQAASSDEDSDSAPDPDLEDAQNLEDDSVKPSQPPPKATSFPADGAKRIAQNLRNVDLDARRREAEAKERARREQERRKQEQMEAEAGFETESESGDEEESESGDEEESEEDTKIDDVAHMGAPPKAAPRRAAATTGSSDESGSDSDSDSDASSSSEDAKPKLLRPVFVPKSQRGAAASTTNPTTHTLTSSNDPHSQARTDALVQATLERHAAAAAAGKKHWDDDDTAESAAVDDTDGLEPELERQQWVARELGRVARARAVLEAREAELAEVERRRGLSAAEREAEDAERLAEQAEEREGRGKAGFMARYHHRGAFFADEAEKEGLLGRDLMGARFEDESARGKEVLPAYLQIRDQTKLGRKGRTKYKDLRSEDTGQWGQFGGRKGETFTGDDRFRPDWQGRGGGAEGGTGANASSLGDRKRSGGGERESEPKRMRVSDG